MYLVICTHECYFGIESGLLKDKYLYIENNGVSDAPQ